jgi:hypothetical protein
MCFRARLPQPQKDWHAPPQSSGASGGQLKPQTYWPVVLVHVGVPRPFEDAGHRSHRPPQLLTSELE